MCGNLRQLSFHQYSNISSDTTENQTIEFDEKRTQIHHFPWNVLLSLRKLFEKNWYQNIPSWVVLYKPGRILNTSDVLNEHNFIIE